MSPNDFIQRYEPEWQKLEKLIAAIGKESSIRWRHQSNAAKQQSPSHAAEFPALYRRTCQHLALARDRHYPPQLIERLNELALAGHQIFYSSRTKFGSHFVDYVTQTFPSLIRIHNRLFWIATALTYIPALIMAWVVWFQPEMVYAILAPEQVAEFEIMYGPGRSNIGFTRDSDTNFLMFGHYIQNNISIGFRCFAGGLIFGLGTILPLVFNGLLFGALAAHLTRVGLAERFFQFVSGHAPFELTAIILCGMAGLMLGIALISPGRLTRKEALASAARIAVQIVYGAAGMLVIAAFIEAFWSSSTLIPPLGKYFVGALMWLLIGVYFLFMGQKQIVKAP